MLIARVVADIKAIDKEFDYLVPDELAADVRVGTMVRVRLAGRRVGGWVVELAEEDPDPTLRIEPIAKVTGWGPPEFAGSSSLSTR